MTYKHQLKIQNPLQLTFPSTGRRFYYPANQPQGLKFILFIQKKTLATYLVTRVSNPLTDNQSYQLIISFRWKMELMEHLP